MKKRIISIILFLTLIISMFHVDDASASTNLKYIYKVRETNGLITESDNINDFTYIVRTYKELKKLKKKIKKVYNDPTTDLKALSQYKKSFFKKNALVFASVQYFSPNYISKLTNVTLNHKTIKLNIDEKWALGDGYGSDMIVYTYKSYFIKIKKSKIPKAKKVKVKIGKIIE